MTIRTCERDSRPASWYEGKRIAMAGRVWELAEIEGNRYHWIDAGAMEEFSEDELKGYVP